MTNDPNTCKTMSVPEWGKQYLGLGRNAAYDAVKRGDIPTIRIGRKIRVPVIAAEKMLENAAAVAVNQA